jgi:hypothetical protein
MYLLQRHSTPIRTLYTKFFDNYTPRNKINKNGVRFQLHPRARTTDN